ncbi:MAG: hypothetical protein PUD80_08170 [Firmicutes bacterium]|nr:hypothetical protein [Bacillota bacterium]
MKKWTAVLVMLVFLTGCSGKSRELQRGLDLRSELLKASQCRFSCEITADYGDRTYTFGMDCQGDSQGNLTFTVTAPETIAGITGKIASGEGSLTFDDTALQFDLMADDRLTPISAPWILLKTLREGFLTSAGMDGERLRLSIDDSYEDDALHLDIWVNDENRPETAEILWGGQKILSLAVTDFKIS